MKGSKMQYFEKRHGGRRRGKEGCGGEKKNVHIEQGYSLEEKREGRKRAGRYREGKRERNVKCREPKGGRN